ncbi:MAG: RNA polymerase sigma factor [Clostridia bacterium]|nr:RNA polymerase sigma factor [Clostridia bacterium]
MTDQRIIELYWQRDQSAIRETDRQYGQRLFEMARRILTDRGESEETVNDTYLRTWESIPPRRPTALFAFLAKITRSLAIDRYRRRQADKRLPSQYALSLDELGECIPGGESPDDALDLDVLAHTIRQWLSTLSPSARDAFVCRYFYADSLEEIAARQRISLSAVKSTLYRARQSLRKHLEKEGYSV